MRSAIKSGKLCKCSFTVITSNVFFFLPSPYCLRNSCTAELRKAPLPELDQRGGAGMEEQHHLEAMNLKPRGLSFKAANGNQRALKLHKLCLRMVRSKLRKTRPRVWTDRQPRDWATVAGNCLLWQHENPIVGLFCFSEHFNFHYLKLDISILIWGFFNFICLISFQPLQSVK